MDARSTDELRGSKEPNDDEDVRDHRSGAQKKFRPPFRAGDHLYPTRADKVERRNLETESFEPAVGLEANGLVIYHLNS